MTLSTLIRRSLRYHARAHLGVVIGAAIAGAALIGALVVGDSARESLRERAVGRLGWIHYALAPQDRFFSGSLDGFLTPVRGTGVGTSLPFLETAPRKVSAALQLPGTVSTGNASARANHVTVLGVDSSFWETNNPIGTIPNDAAVINEALARQLHAQAGQELLLRIQKPSAISREMAMTPHNEETLAFRVKVHAVLPDSSMAGFNLKTGPGAPFNVFIPLDQLREKTNLKGKANLVVSGPVFQHVTGIFFPPSSALRRVALNLELAWSKVRQRKVYIPGTENELDPEASAVCLRNRLMEVTSLESLGFKLRILTNQHSVELRSDNIFLEPELVRAVDRAERSYAARPVLTLLANQICAGPHTTPYSMITAAGDPHTPKGLRDNEILLSQWLADDLGASPGDQVSVTYFDPESGAQLVDKTNTFRVNSIVPQQLPWDDRTLMPDFPGIEKAESTSDWDAGFPLKYKIRPKDEEYWKKYKGTPKAFVTLKAGQKMWGNRFGSVTAIRFRVPAGEDVGAFQSELSKELMETLFPSALGLLFDPVRERALKGVDQSQDFGELFLGFSIFLVISALLLMALLFHFGLEQRTSEIGILLALGFRPKQVRRMFLLEGAALAFLGTLLGVAGGLGYAKAMLWGLRTIWRSAVAGSVLDFHLSIGTLSVGVCTSVVVATLAIWITLRRQGKQQVRELLEPEQQHIERPRSRGDTRRPTRSWALWGGVLASATAVATVAWAWGKPENAESFFSAGSLLLIGGLLILFAWLGILARTRQTRTLTQASLAVRGSARRRKRSIATIALLSSGCFVIVSLAVFRLDANQDALKRSSGTGGFSLIGESTLPIVQDLNTPAGREAFGLSDQDLSGTTILPCRVHEGDEASCLNLNGAQKPRVIGVRPDMLAGRFSFTEKSGPPVQDGWMLLRGAILVSTDSTNNQAESTSSADEVPAIADANSIQWALHKKVGDSIDYVDESGRAFKLRLVGAVANSTLQGNVIIDETEFVKRFPRESGYKMFFIDTPTNQVSQVSEKLTRALQDVGLELTPAVERLNAFNSVQNTYLGTFQMLGGLGLLLGSAGLAIVVLRNLFERRGELALLMAVGFTKRSLHELTLIEHVALLALGLGLGVVAAGVAVLPTALAPGKSLPLASLAITLVAVLGNGLLWTWIATRLALRGNLLHALRNE